MYSTDHSKTAPIMFNPGQDHLIACRAADGKRIEVTIIL